MSKAIRRSYSTAYKMQAVREVLVDKKVAARVAEDKGIPGQTLHNWVKFAQKGMLVVDAGLAAPELDYLIEFCQRRMAQLDVPAKNNPLKSRAEHLLVKGLYKKLRQARKVKSFEIDRAQKRPG